MVTTTEVGQALCQVLRQGKDVHRCAAAQALGLIGYEGAVDSLIERLQDQDEDVRVDAAEALGLIRQRRVGPALLETLIEDPCNDVKLVAVTALARLGEASAVPILRELVRSRDGAVIWDEEEFLAGGWDDWLDVQIKAIEALAEVGVVEAVPDIVAALDDEMGQDLSSTAFPALARLGKPGIGVLKQYLDARDERLRRRAAESLCAIGSAEACDVLAVCLNDGSAAVHATAVRALASRNAADPRLAPLFEDRNAEVRATVVTSCGRHWPERAGLLFDDPSDQVQAAVVNLFAANPSLPRPENFALRLRVKMRGPSEKVAVAACAAIVTLVPADCVADLSEQLHDRDCPAEVRRAAARALGTVATEPAIEALAETVDDDDREVRMESLAALSRIARSGPVSGNARAVLLGALSGESLPVPEATEASEARTEQVPSDPPTADPDGGNGEAAPTDQPPWPTSTLAAITDDGASPGLQAPAASVQLDEADLELLSLTGTMPRKKHVPLNPPLVVHEDVRRFAARVLGDVPVLDVAEALGQALGDEDIEIRRRAADSLMRLGESMTLSPKVRDALIAVADDADRDLRLAATRALGRTDKDAKTVLAERLKDSDGFVRAEAAKALAALGAVGPEVVELLSDDYPGVRLAAAQAVAKSDGPQAVDLLLGLAFAHAGMHKEELAALLRELDRDAAGTRLLTVLRDPGEQTRWRIAVDVLKELYRSDGEPAARLVA